MHSREEGKQLYTIEQLQKIAGMAYSMQNRAAHGKENLQTEYVGTVKKGNRLYDYFVDTEKNHWYTLRFQTPAGEISEYEHVFGHPERKKRRTRRWEDIEKAIDGIRKL